MVFVVGVLFLGEFFHVFENLMCSVVNDGNYLFIYLFHFDHLIRFVSLLKKTCLLTCDAGSP